MVKERIIAQMEKTGTRDLNKYLMNFIEYPWHDAILKEIRIDRSNPGYDDTITMIIIWDSGNESKIAFKNVYYAQLNLNFGVIADECISEVKYLAKHDEEVLFFIKKWELLIPNIKELFFLEIRTSSTGSCIRIFTKEIEVT
jgi:hypothetical protein